jgi:hypothetical protein
MVEHRVFIPLALSHLSTSALAVLERHLGITATTRAAAHRTDLYAITGFARLGLKKRAVVSARSTASRSAARSADATVADSEAARSAESAAPESTADWELKVCRAVFVDGAETLEKFVLPHDTLFDDGRLGLTDAERDAAASSAAGGGARALVTKRRRTGTHGELVDVELESRGSRSSWVTWCFEASWWGGAGPRERGAALLAALAEADADALTGAVTCSYAAWVEMNALLPLPSLPPLPQISADNASASAFETASQSLLCRVPSQMTSPVKDICGLQCSYFAVSAAAAAAPLLHAARAGDVGTFQNLYGSLLLRASVAKATSRSRAFTETIFCPAVLQHAGALLRAAPPPAFNYTGPAPFASIKMPLAAPRPRASLVLDEFRVCELNRDLGPDAVDTFFGAAPGLRGEDARANGARKLVLPRVEWRALLDEFAGLHGSGRRDDDDCGPRVAVLHRHGEALAVIADGDDRLLVLDSHASVAGWMTSAGLGEYLSRGGRDHVLLLVSTGTATP